MQSIGSALFGPQSTKPKYLQIPVLEDLPVGERLQDHVAMGGIIFMIDREVSMVQPRYENIGSTLQYAMFGGGKIFLLVFKKISKKMFTKKIEIDFFNRL